MEKHFRLLIIHLFLFLGTQSIYSSVQDSEQDLDNGDLHSFHSDDFNLAAQNQCLSPKNLNYAFNKEDMSGKEKHLCQTVNSDDFNPAAKNQCLSDKDLKEAMDRKERSKKERTLLKKFCNQRGTIQVQPQEEHPTQDITEMYQSNIITIIPLNDVDQDQLPVNSKTDEVDKITDAPVDNANDNSLKTMVIDLYSYFCLGKKNKVHVEIPKDK
ncbi:MAG: hypothetical protein JO129_04845 [Candidatus Dependentiae bacterium]|nr:hypothetical protein [Candidatus Dependentiae bacterium]